MESPLGFRGPSQAQCERVPRRPGLSDTADFPRAWRGRGRVGKPGGRESEGTWKSSSRFSGRTRLIRLRLGPVSKCPGPPGGSAWSPPAVRETRARSLALEDPRAEAPAAPSRVLENNRDCVVRGVAKRRTRLSDAHFFKRLYLVEISVYG